MSDVGGADGIDGPTRENKRRTERAHDRDDARGSAGTHDRDDVHRSAVALDRGLPGAIAVSRLRVYDWPTADALHGGSPHLHTASTEGYVVVAGSGAVETLSSQGLQRTELWPGTIAWFTPGTIHRLINSDGALEIVTLMQNAGLPEAGDAVLTFPLDVLRDPELYRIHATLPDTGDQTVLAAAARTRRDLAIAGYRQLRERAASDPDGALGAVHAAAAALVAPRIAEWRTIVTAGPRAQLKATERQLDALAAGEPGDLDSSGFRAAQPMRAPELWGMCGRLTVWPTQPVS